VEPVLRGDEAGIVEAERLGGGLDLGAEVVKDVGAVAVGDLEAPLWPVQDDAVDLGKLRDGVLEAGEVGAALAVVGDELAAARAEAAAGGIEEIDRPAAPSSRS